MFEEEEAVEARAQARVDSMKPRISSGYPATMTAILSRWSSIRFSRVSTASWPKSLPVSFDVSE